jgi:hypothetical protein
MRRGIVAMSQKERQRYHLLKMVVERKTTLHDVGRLMEISYRHAKRLKRKLVSEGSISSPRLIRIAQPGIGCFFALFPHITC